MQGVNINKFTFGIEMENYCPDWNLDHDQTHETRSPVFNNFNGLLIYCRNIVKRHMDDNNFVLHSSPQKYRSTISSHIHFKANIDRWNTSYSWDIYERLYELVNLFQFFFKNSPSKDCLSKRQKNNNWCHLRKLGKETFKHTERDNEIALTPNKGIGTLEFRLNDVPKSLNQLVMFYYLVYIASRRDIEVPVIDNWNMDSVGEIEKLKNDLFSYKDVESVKSFKVAQKDILFKIAEDMSKKMGSIKFWDFNKGKYCSFKTLVTNTFNHDLGLFKGFTTENKWSNDRKKEFCKMIKKELIKGV